MKTKEKVEQGKGTADHLMPLGYLLLYQETKSALLTQFKCNEPLAYRNVEYFLYFTAYIHY